MKTNIGTVDRALRIIIGLLLIAGTLGGMIGWWGWIGVLPLATGIVGVCPAYMPFGINTCGTSKPGGGLSSNP